MAAEPSTENTVKTLFTNLETRRSLLSSCTSLYQTLTSHFHSLQHSISSKSQTLDTILQTLDSNFESSLHSLTIREQSIPNRLSSLTSQIETLTQLALSETKKPDPENPPSIADDLKSLCVKMDRHELLKFIMSRRKEAADLKRGIVGALEECVDSPRLVLDSVREFMDLKANVKSGQPDMRWACGIVVVGMFPFDELKKRKEEDSRVLFSRAVSERAAEMAKEWKEKALERAASGVATVSGEGVFGMGPCEASMFLHFVTGFGLKDKFEYEFLKSLVLEFPSRKDIAKLAGPLFGKKVVEGIINELLQMEKDVDAVYFAIEAGLTDKFNPVSLLKSFLFRAEKNAEDTLTKGNNSSEATDEASIIERTALRHIVRSVEGNRLEDDFPLTSAKERLSNLEKIMNDKKAALDCESKSGSQKRGHRRSGPPPSHPAKVQKFSGPYRPPYGQRNVVSSAHQNPVSRYPGPYSYPSQTVYGGSHLPGSAQVAFQPPPYVVQYGGNVGGTAPHGGPYGSNGYATGPLNRYPLSYTQ